MNAGGNLIPASIRKDQSNLQAQNLKKQYKSALDFAIAAGDISAS